MISIKERKEKIEYLKARIFEINQLNEEIKGNDLYNDDLLEDYFEGSKQTEIRYALRNCTYYLGIMIQKLQSELSYETAQYNMAKAKGN